MIDPYEAGDIVNLGPLKELRGGTVDLKDFRGKKIVVLAFWLNSCDLCMEQIKLVDNFIAKGGRGKKFALITIVRAGGEEREITLDSLHENKLAPTVILDPDLNVARKFGVTTAPTFIFIDKNGRLVPGQITYADKPIRSLSLFNMIDLMASGKYIPALQFIPFTENARLRGIIGKQAPKFQIGSIDGKVFSLGDYRSKMNVVLIFWHPYSPECISDIRLLNGFYSLENREKYNFVILAAASLYGQSQMDKSRKIFKEVQPDFPFLDDADSIVGKLYNVNSIPTIFIIGKNGVVADVVSNESTSAGIEKRIAAALEAAN